MSDLLARVDDIARRARERDNPNQNASDCPMGKGVWDEYTGIFGRPQYFRWEENGRTIVYGKPYKCPVPLVPGLDR